MAASPRAFPRVHGEIRRAVLSRFPYAVYFHKVACGTAPAAEQARTPEDVQARPARRFGSLVPLSAGHAYASLADARSSFGDNGGGGDGAPQRLISAWSSLRSTISSRPQRVFNALGHLIANEGSDEGKRLQLQL